MKAKKEEEEEEGDQHEMTRLEKIFQYSTGQLVKSLTVTNSKHSIDKIYKVIHTNSLNVKSISQIENKL